MNRYKSRRKRYYQGKGWHGDSKAHALAAKGISLGRTRKYPTKFSNSELQDYRRQLAIGRTPVSSEFREEEPSSFFEQAVLNASTDDDSDVLISNLSADNVTIQGDSRDEGEKTPVSRIFDLDEEDTNDASDENISDEEPIRPIPPEQEDKLGLAPSISDVLPLTSTFNQDLGSDI